jgi:DNA-binding NarL/FixJ family response regulator
MAERKRPIRVAVVNDYELVVEGVAAMLAPFSDRVVVVELDAGSDPSGAADIVLFDTFAGRRTVADRVERIARDPEMGRIVLYTWDVPEEFEHRIHESPVDAVILKSVAGADLVTALEHVHHGLPVPVHAAGPLDVAAPLSEREREVLALLGQGCSNRQIADELYLSVNTVKTHAASVFAKLGVANRTQAARYAIEHGLVARPVRDESLR